MTTEPPHRDDLFTHIHKALRLALFDVAARTGRTDWNHPADVAALAETWHPVLVLLRAHTDHEDTHILRILDSHDRQATEPVDEQHRDLDDLLDDLADRFDAVLATPDPALGLDLYRDLARFIADYLPHLHDEETRVMARIWELCNDTEIALTRAAFMADTPPDVTATTVEYMLRALDPPTRHALVARLAATAPAPAVDAALRIAARVLDPVAYAETRAAAGA